MFRSFGSGGVPGSFGFGVSHPPVFLGGEETEFEGAGGMCGLGRSALYESLGDSSLNESLRDSSLNESLGDSSL